MLPTKSVNKQHYPTHKDLPLELLPDLLVRFVLLSRGQTLGLSQAVHGDGQENVQEDVCYLQNQGNQRQDSFGMPKQCLSFTSIKNKC